MNKLIKNIMQIFLILLLFYASAKVFAEDNTITVYCNKEIGQINKKVYGNNFIGYDPASRNPEREHYYGYADYGAGIWDPKWEEPVKEVIDLAKDAGVSIIRFPGGDDANWYNWKVSIAKERDHFLFGVDELLQSCDEIGAQVVFTVSCLIGEEKDAADLVRYLNGGAEKQLIRELKIKGFKLKDEEYRRLFDNYVKDRNGNLHWANYRAINGHVEPYNVKYFEIGNEISTKMSALEYGNKYLKYYRAMKAVDFSIKIGAVLHTSDWDKKVLDIVKDKIDFGIVHIYPTPAWGEKLSKIPPRDIFGITLALPEFQYQKYIEKTQETLEKYAGKKIPLAVTEFNCGFVQNWPVPYRHTLGCALVNAELLKIFMRPDNNILMANYWNFNNSYTGMIANGFDGKYKNLHKPYYKRPNFYVFEFYNKHFGDVLLDVDVKCGGYNLGKFEDYLGDRYLDNLEGRITGEDLLKGKKWEIRDLGGVDVKEKGDILSIEFKEPKNFNYYHTYKICRVEPNTYYKISGYIKTENLQVNEKESGFRLEVQDIRGWTKTKWAKSTKDTKGTSDWVYVEKVFKTLPDAGAIKIIARRNGKRPPLRGKAFIKNTKLFKIKTKDYIVPYLSVNASKSRDGKKFFLMVINKNLDEDIKTEIKFKGFNNSKSSAKIFTLWGRKIDETNEGWPYKVKVYKEEIKFSGDSFKVSFKKHSLTAIEIEDIENKGE